MSDTIRWKDRDVKDPLRYERLVRKMAGSWHRSTSLDFEDYKSAGWIGVMLALKKLDPDRSVSSYIIKSIDSAMKDLLSITLWGGRSGNYNRRIGFELPGFVSHDNVFDFCGQVEQDECGGFYDNLIAALKDIKGFKEFMYLQENKHKGNTVRGLAKETGMSYQGVYVRIDRFKEAAVKKLLKHWRKHGIENEWNS